MAWNGPSRIVDGNGWNSVGFVDGIFAIWRIRADVANTNYLYSLNWNFTNANNERKQFSQKKQELHQHNQDTHIVSTNNFHTSLANKGHNNTSDIK